MPKYGKEINDREILFIEHYLIHGDATQAAIAAGYSPHRANQQGYQVLHRPKIQKYIQKRLDKAAMTADEVLSELADIAKSEWRDFIEVSHDEEGNVKVKMRLADKIKALELLGRNHKLFTDKIEASGPDGKPIETTATIIIQGVKSSDGK